MCALLLRPQIRDTGLQQEAVRESGLDWVLVQPVNLTDDGTIEPAFASADGDCQTMKVSRQQVGEFLADVALSGRHLGQSVALSAHAREGEPAPAGVAR